jgi:hypothetical protein
MIGCPILRVLGEVWDTTTLIPKPFSRRLYLSHPSPRTRRMGHPIIGGDEKEENTDLGWGFAPSW